MTFTYDTTTSVGRLRLAIGDTVEDDAEFTDAELEVLIDVAGSWQAAAVMGCDSLIAKYAKLVDITLGPRKEALGQIVEHYKTLRAHLAQGVGGTIQTEDLTFSWTEEESSDSEYAT